MNSDFNISFMVQNIFCSLAAFCIFSCAVYVFNCTLINALYIYIYIFVMFLLKLKRNQSCIVHVQQHKNTVFPKASVSFFSKLFFCC